MDKPFMALTSVGVFVLRVLAAESVNTVVGQMHVPVTYGIEVGGVFD